MKREEIKSWLPGEIEELSFSMIQQELEQNHIQLPEEKAYIIKRVIHTTADFEYASTLTFTEDAVEQGLSLLSQGARIVTDTQMGLSGIAKAPLEALGGNAECFMSHPKVAQEAKERGETRAAVSMEWAAKDDRPTIFAIGNAPTALIRLYDLMEQGYEPGLIIGVPVGFVNVVQAKELILSTKASSIVNRGRKGGSNVAAAICNSLLYHIREEYQRPWR